MCFSFIATLKTFRTKTQIEPVIEHPDMVHHMLLYQCPPFVTETYDSACFTGNIVDSCFGVVAAWGVGGEVKTK